MWTHLQSYINQSAMSAGSAADSAEVRKRAKYPSLIERYLFEPVAIETAGVYGVTSARIIGDIGRRIVEAKGDVREGVWFEQRLGLAVQRGNAFSILSSVRNLV